MHHAIPDITGLRDNLGRMQRERVWRGRESTRRRREREKEREREKGGGREREREGEHTWRQTERKGLEGERVSKEEEG